MRYRVQFYPMLNQTLAVVSTTWQRGDSAENQYNRTWTLKTQGERWDLPDLLRELAETLDVSKP